MDEPTPPSKEPPRVVALVVVGTLATLCGLATSIDHADHLMWLGDGQIGDTAAEAVASVGGRAVLVLAETMACLLFTVLVGVALAVRDRDVAPAVFTSAAMAKVLWLVVSVSSHWAPGWYYILDPSKRGWALWLAVFSVLQALLWVVAAVNSRRS